MKYLKSKQYDNEFIKENMMGPNSMIILENLLESVPLTSNMRVLDLGCGKGLTSIFLAKEYGVQVFAVDLWISASENYKRFKKMGLDNQIIPIHADAISLPFAEDYFDAVISIDAYHYFGCNETYFDTCLSKLLKKDALIAIGIPGMKYEIHNCIPDEMKPYWEEEALALWNSCDWWEKLLLKSNSFEIKKIHEMDCFNEAWQDWLKTNNRFALEDRLMIETDNGRYMNLISILGNKK
ncbi:SAM-dependent methyltransferase [Abyssisolibacter fermentans]|uniref:SAM-dependent methyltransferase n=1 Tax=Abyssisolibacter fermentans TaxID=1766203 RepID=UPI000835777F|nr:methyltransferase domain-containing protein [Abyssisolibacter fermentans]